jgi:hypothetical protein
MEGHYLKMDLRKRGYESTNWLKTRLNDKYCDDEPHFPGFITGPSFVNSSIYIDCLVNALYRGDRCKLFANIYRKNKSE